MDNNTIIPVQGEQPKKKVWQWLKRDAVVLIACLLAFAACAYTINHVGTYVQRCNEQWVSQLSQCSCLCSDGKVIDFTTGTTLPQLEMICGDGYCMAGENPLICPRDCK